MLQSPPHMMVIAVVFSSTSVANSKILVCYNDTVFLVFLNAFVQWSTTPPLPLPSLSPLSLSQPVTKSITASSSLGEYAINKRPPRELAKKKFPAEMIYTQQLTAKYDC